MIEFTIKPKQIVKNIAFIALGATAGYYGNDLLDNKQILEDYTRQQYVTEDGMHLKENGYRFIPREFMYQAQPEQEKELPRG